MSVFGGLCASVYLAVINRAVYEKQSPVFHRCNCECLIRQVWRCAVSWLQMCSVCACLTYSLSCDKTQPCRLDIDLADPPSGPKRLCFVHVCVTNTFTCSSLYLVDQISCKCLWLLESIF